MTRAGLNSYHRITFISKTSTASHRTDINTKVELLTCLTALMRYNVVALICALHERDLRSEVRGDDVDTNS